MREVVRGSRASVDQDRTTSPTSPIEHDRHAHFDLEAPNSHDSGAVLSQSESRHSESRSGRRKSSQYRRERRQSADQEERDAYYDSRAATKKEFKRRASTLQEYYAENPTLLPQLPFTWRHGWRRWKLFFLIFIMFIDACALPIILYYAMFYAGHVQGWIIFAIVTTIWGGPTYLEFASRSWRLIKKENFYRPLGSNNRWAFDITHWILVLTIAAITTFFIVGSAPHIVFLRVLALPGPAILLCLGGPVLILTIYSMMGWKAPFRLSSTPKGGDVYPGVFYLIEDIVSVNASAGRPYREAIHARYVASPRFRRTMKNQSLFWSVPAVCIAIVLIILICIHPIPKDVAYGIGWGIPFIWGLLWALLCIPWVRRDMHKETETWELDSKIVPRSDRDEGDEATPDIKKEPEP